MVLNKKVKDGLEELTPKEAIQLIEEFDAKCTGVESFRASIKDV